MDIDDLTKPNEKISMKMTTDAINTEKGLGIDNAIIRTISCCGKIHK